MREIKLQAWDKINKIIFEPVFVSNNMIFTVYEDGSEYKLLELPEKNCIIRQYTTFKDKNNKEIYEYDIVEEYETYYIVLWNEGKGWDSQPNGFYLFPLYSAWYLNKTGNDYTNSDSYGKIEILSDKTTTIIGNVFENPELLQNPNIGKENFENKKASVFEEIKDDIIELVGDDDFANDIIQQIKQYTKTNK